jgi:hypothetical protein
MERARYISVENRKAKVYAYRACTRIIVQYSRQCPNQNHKPKSNVIIAVMSSRLRLKSKSITPFSPLYPLDPKTQDSYIKQHQPQ